MRIFPFLVVRRSISSVVGGEVDPGIAEGEQLRDRRGRIGGCDVSGDVLLAVEVGELESRFAAKVDPTDHDALPGRIHESRHAAEGGAAEAGVEDGLRHELGERFAIEVGSCHDMIRRRRVRIW